MEFTIEHWPLDRLLPYAANARTHSDDQIGIDALGQRVDAPIGAPGGGGEHVAFAVGEWVCHRFFLSIATSYTLCSGPIASA